MKICHVAGLALAGWCLMMPPFVQGKHGLVDGDAPLSKWTVTNTFDTAAECENFRATSMIFRSETVGAGPNQPKLHCVPCTTRTIAMYRH
jgi:hypothetical protein